MNQIDGHFFFDRLKSGLQDRIVVAPRAATNRWWQIVYIQSGAAVIVHAGAGDPADANTIEAPALVCLPDNAQRQIKLLAGSSGVHLALDGLGMANVLGNRPEAVELRVMLRDMVALRLGASAEQDVLITQAVNAIGIEVQRQQPGHLVMIEAQLRCVLIQLWRHIYSADAVPFETGPRNGVLWRFRQLVEINFRSRWRVADYASALGTTTDRLHDLATQKLTRTPLQLIHERTHREARALLTRSTLTLDQIAAYLGFKTTAQFSAFFRKQEDMPPGKYRTAHAARQAGPVIEQAASFTDWP